jgi:membrane-anchored protein YejM (alkaline phosphatase superfamily)
MRSINRSIIVTWLCLFFVIGSYASLSVSVTKGGIYLLIVTLLQASLFIVPLLLMASIYSKTQMKSLLYLAHITAIALILLVLSNYKLHSMYNFFIDGFVINLLYTPGGVEAL